MNYQETCDYLFSRTTAFETQGKSGYKEGLENTLALDEHFGHPHQKYLTIHVAGTNGKGSVSNMLSAALQKCGYRVGLYTSPHLVDFRERIRVNGEMIPEDYVVNFVENERNFWEPLSPSFFEVTTAMAFKYFAEQNIDIAIIEVGLGGRLDCTNIIHPILSVITNISLDHTEFLGNTIAEIAQEKAGIIKHATTVIIGENQEETRPVFEEKAREMEAPIIFAEDDNLIKSSEITDQGDIKCETNKYGNVFCDLGGIYQPKNINTALHALQILEDKGYLIIDPEATSGNVIKAFDEVKKLTGLAGRWQTISSSPHVICDTGHNPGGWRFISQQLNHVIAHCHQLHIIFGMVDDKDVDAILQMLPKEAIYYFTKAKTKRALNEQIIFALAQKYQLKGKTYLSVSEAYHEAEKAAGNNDVIFVGGSNYIVGELLKDGI